MKKAIVCLFLISIAYGCSDVQLNKILDKQDYYIEYLTDDLEVYRYNDQTIMNGNFKIISNNSLKESFSVEDGVLFDAYKTYYPNGKIASHCYYENGIKNGEELLYYSSGKLKTKQSYKNNKKNESSISYYENGSVQRKTDSIGKTNYYAEDGAVYMEHSSDNNYDQNKIYKNGKLHMEEYEYEHSSGLINVIKFYNEDGSVKKIIGLRFEDKNESMLILDKNHKILDSIDPKKDKVRIMKLLSELGPEIAK